MPRGSARSNSALKSSPPASFVIAPLTGAVVILGHRFGRLLLDPLQLDVSLDPYDDSDVAQAEALLKLPVEERLQSMYAQIAFADELRETYRRAVGE